MRAARLGEGGPPCPATSFSARSRPRGRKTLHAHPDRVDAVNEEITAFGCKVVAQYAVLGPYDFVTLIDAPDNETVAHLSVDLGSRGTVNILTLPAIEIGDFRRQLERREQLGHD
jgi:uncharacterized protein with GYD domain